ncbi:MAG: hypothetical protein FWE09_02370 [Treponema sp.]|nr:hypothetical protein [Treponema sp.]
MRKTSIIIASALAFCALFASCYDSAPAWSEAVIRVCNDSGFDLTNIYVEDARTIGGMEDIEAGWSLEASWNWQSGKKTDITISFVRNGIKRQANRSVNHGDRIVLRIYDNREEWE